MGKVNTNRKTSKPVIVYDGRCNFCIAQVNRIRKLDKGCLFEYLPRQDRSADTRFPVLRTIDFNKGMRLIMPDGTGNFSGADAIYQIARRLPVVSTFAWLYRIPGIHQLARLVYAWVARNRTWLSGITCDDNSCDANTGSKQG